MVYRAAYSSIGFYKNQVGGAVSRKMVYSLDSFKHLGVADEISHEKFLCSGSSYSRQFGVGDKSIESNDYRGVDEEILQI